MIFEGARDHDIDPPLRPDRLACGGTIALDEKLRRKAIRWRGITEWLAVAVIVVVVFGLLVALP